MFKNVSILKLHLNANCRIINNYNCLLTLVDRHTMYIKAPDKSTRISLIFSTFRFLLEQSLITPEPTPNVCDVDQHYKQFRAGCYVFMNQPLPWANASAKCSQQGAALASINSPYEQAFVYVMIQQQSHVVPAIWIGLNDRQVYFH